MEVDQLRYATVHICTKAVRGNLSHVLLLWMTEGEQGGEASEASDLPG